jgi:phosphoglucomutase
MQRFRNQPPTTLAGHRIIKILDYKTSIQQNLADHTTEPIQLPKSDVLQFYTEDGSKISVRPSGTEPKIKFYVSVHAPLPTPGDFQRVNELLDSKITAIEKEILK